MTSFELLKDEAFIIFLQILILINNIYVQYYAWY